MARQKEGRETVTAEQAMRKMNVLPMYVCNAVEWFYFGNIVFDPIKMEEWLHRRGLIDEGVSVRDALAAHWGPELADAVDENIRNGGARQ